MKEPSEARKRTLALQARALQFSNNLNPSYPHGPMNHPSEIVWRVMALGLEQEADELSAIFSTIITNMEKRLARGKERRRR